MCFCLPVSECVSLTHTRHTHTLSGCLPCAPVCICMCVCLCTCLSVHAVTALLVVNCCRLCQYATAADRGHGTALWETTCSSLPTLALYFAKGRAGVCYQRLSCTAHVVHCLLTITVPDSGKVEIAPVETNVMTWVGYEVVIA